MVLGVNDFKGTPFFTLSKGRGRTCPGLDPGFGRLRPKSVRGLPRNQPSGYATVSRGEEGRVRGLPGKQP